MATGLRLYCASLCEPQNPGGWGCWGWLAYDGSAEVWQEAGGMAPTPGMTHHLAAYIAVGKALAWCRENNHASPALFTDSETVVNQVMDVGQCDDARLRKYRDAVMTHCVALGGVPFLWIAQEQNAAARGLVRDCYRELSGLVLTPRRMAEARRG